MESENNRDSKNIQKEYCDLKTFSRLHDYLSELEPNFRCEDIWDLENGAKISLV